MSDNTNAPSPGIFNAAPATPVNNEQQLAIISAPTNLRTISFRPSHRAAEATFLFSQVGLKLGDILNRLLETLPVCAMRHYIISERTSLPPAHCTECNTPLIPHVCSAIKQMQHPEVLQPDLLILDNY